MTFSLKVLQIRNKKYKMNKEEKLEKNEEIAMQNCLGIYIENNLIKYAKISKDKNDFNVESYGIKFFENINEAVKKVIEETYSFNTPISINLANEKYLYFDIFALLSKTDVQKTIQTEYEAFCEENKYNTKAFENKYALVPNIENKEKIRAIDILVNKIELNKQKQYLEKANLTKIMPIGTSIACLPALGKKENSIIVNMEEKTTITTIYDRQVYNVEMMDSGSQEVLEKINRVENSMSKAYEICKGTTIYTSSVIDDTKEQPYLETIIPTLYTIAEKVKKIVEESPVKIGTVYLTGTLAVVNNIDLYFQEILQSIDCKILKPRIIEEASLQNNIKDYIEVNSAISLAMQGLGEGIQALNFKESSLGQNIKQILNANVSFGKKQNKTDKNGKPKKEININLKGALDKTEVMLIRTAVAIILINILFTVFSKTLMKQMDKKQKEVEGLISEEQAQITKIKNNTNSINTKTTKYQALTEELKAINEKISKIAEMKNSIPNLLNQIMYVIPEEVRLASIENTSGKNIKIVAESANYDQLGYFIAKIKLEGYLKDVVSSSGQKNGDIVKVTIEGVLP